MRVKQGPFHEHEMDTWNSTPLINTFCTLTSYMTSLHKTLGIMQEQSWTSLGGEDDYFLM